MRFIKKWLLITGIALIAHSGALFAETSAFVGTFASFGTPSQEVGIGARGNIDYRTMLSSIGFLKISSFAEVSYDFTSKTLSDQLSAAIQGTWFVGDDDVSVSVGSRASFSGYAGEDSYWIPDWEIAYRMFRGHRDVNPYLSYTGFATDTSHFHGLNLGFRHTPHVEFTYGMAIGGGIESIFGIETPDYLVSLSGNLEGLVGYTVSWQLQGEVTYRDSSDSTNEGFSGEITGQLTATPSKRYQFHIAPTWYQTYLLATHQWEIAIDLAARMDMTLAEQLYVHVSPIVSWDHLQDRSATTTALRLTVGLDMGF